MVSFRLLALPVMVALAAIPTIALAQEVARTPTVTGNAWVAYGIIGVVVAGIYMLIMGALHVERRDARLGRESHDHGFFGFDRRDDDDTGPNSN